MDITKCPNNEIFSDYFFLHLILLCTNILLRSSIYSIQFTYHFLSWSFCTSLECSFSSDPYKFNALLPMHYPQQPMPTTGINTIPRFALIGSEEINSITSTRSDINAWWSWFFWWHQSTRAVYFGFLKYSVSAKCSYSFLDPGSGSLSWCEIYLIQWWL